MFSGGGRSHPKMDQDSEIESNDKGVSTTVLIYEGN
jgi:hypothetical protein